MRRSLRLATVALPSFALSFAAFVFACSDSTTLDTTENPTTATQVIGPAGGSVVATDGTILTIPAGALASDISITIAPNPTAPLLQNATEVGTPHIFGPEGQKFLKPVTVTLAVDPTLIPTVSNGARSQILVYTAPLSSSDYETLPTIVTDATHVTGTTTHFCNMVPGWSLLTDGGAPSDASADAADADAGDANTQIDASADAQIDATIDAALDAGVDATDAADASDAQTDATHDASDAG